MSNLSYSNVESKEGSYIKLLKNFPFVAYLISLFLGAFNDNAYKTVVMLIALSQFDTGYVDFYFIGAQLGFILPYLLFAGYAGYLADIYSKTKVFIATKFLEVIIMLFILYFLPTVNKPALIGILFLLSAQSMFFSPAKYGILPEIFDETEISRANGLLELATFVSIILGTAFGGVLMQYFANSYIIIALNLFGLSVIGFVLSFFIPKVNSSGSNKSFKINPWHEISLGIKEMRKDSILTLSILGITVFFSMALILTTNLLVFGKEILHLENYQLGILNATMGLGIGVGSCLAGWLSGDKIEYGLIPFGVLGIATCCFFLGFLTNIYYVCLILFFAGVMAGIFVVPLNALLQEIPHKHQKGRLISTNNFFNGVGMIVAVLLLWVLQLKFSSDYIMLVLSLILFGFNFIALLVSPLFFVRFILWILVHTLYRVKVKGKLDIPYKGAAVIVANKVSALDGLLISIALPRFVRYFVTDSVYQHPFFKLILKFVKAIPYDADNQENFMTSASKAREALVQGHIVCIFKDDNIDIPKNNIPFEVFYDSVVSELDVPVFPIYIDQPWNGIIAYSKGKTRLVAPEQFPVEVIMTLGNKLESTSATAEDIKREMHNLTQKVMSSEDITSKKKAKYIENYLAKEFIKTATTYPQETAVIDNLGYKISYHKLSNYVLALSKLLKKDKNLTKQKSIAVLIPNSFFNILCNIALVFAGYKVINLDTNNSNKISGIIDKYQIKKIFTVTWFVNNANYISKESLVILKSKNIELLDFENYYKEISSNTFYKISFIKYLVPSKYLVKIYGKIILDLDYRVTGFENFTITQSSIKNKLRASKKFLGLRRKDNILSVVPYSNMDSYIMSFWLPIIVGSSIVTHTNFNVKNTEELKQYINDKHINILIDFSENFNKYINFAYSCFKHLHLAVVLTKVDQAVINSMQNNSDFTDIFAKLDTDLIDNFKQYFKNANLLISTYSEEQGMFLLSYKDDNNNYYGCCLESA